MALVAHPYIYEINAWVWLRERGWGLADVPSEEWDRIGELGFDAVWLMGVWERSPAGVETALRNDALVESFRRALPDYTDADVVGSPYCIRDYRVAAELGGEEGLAAAREKLTRCGLKLILDFVPNHVAPDHPWTAEHPEFFIRGSDDDLHRDPASYVRVRDNVLANGRDPYFPAWPDVVQLNAFSPELRAEVRSTLGRIAQQCDGVRCDMAMLMMNDIFERTWGERAGGSPPEEYWPSLIEAVKAGNGDFVFIAEAYWDLEYALQQQGFDYCYDKRLYDRLLHEDASSIHGHLTGDTTYQKRLVRFIENHDEPRAASVFPPGRARAAAVATLTQTGARLVHDGQLEGRRVQLPVFLGRRPDEQPDGDLRSFYERLLEALDDDVFRSGSWELGETGGWDGNDGWRNLLAWGWHGDGTRKLVVVNVSDSAVEGHVSLPWEELADADWTLSDASSGEVYERSGNDLCDGLYVSLPAFGWHLFDLMRRAGS